MRYTIKQVAEMFGVTEHTIRFYTDNGLLPCGRDAANKRVFDEESMNWMRGISCLKHRGASLEDIREYCELCRQPESEENLRAMRSSFASASRRISGSMKRRQRSNTWR